MSSSSARKEMFLGNRVSVVALFCGRLFRCSSVCRSPNMAGNLIGANGRAADHPNGSEKRSALALM